MKTNSQDAALSEILRQRRLSATLPPQFCASVWRRIEEAESRTEFTLIARLSAWVEAVLPRPKIALCYMSALLLLGTASGLWTAQGQSHRLDAKLSARYVHSIDPYRSTDSTR